MAQGYNTRCPAVKRILREAQELHVVTEEYYAQPLEDNLFEWHFTVRGPIDSDFQEGIYHGRIILPSEYPMKPPNIIFTTMNGRFETHKKICLSISGHHPETWQPSWSIRTALLAIIGYMPSRALGTIASLDYTPEERQLLAKRSVSDVCPQCGAIDGVLLPRTTSNAAALNKEAQEISRQMTVTEKPLNESSDSKNGTSPDSLGEASPHESLSLSMSKDDIAAATPASVVDTASKTEPTASETNGNNDPTIPIDTSLRQREITVTTTTCSTFPINSTTARSTPSSVPAVTPSARPAAVPVRATRSQPPAAVHGPLGDAVQTVVLYTCMLVFAALFMRRMFMLADDEDGRLIDAEDFAL